jgi:malate dehydrogenase
VPVSEVTNVAIWGNHSATQYPDFTNARIGGKVATEVITDRAWLEGDFLTTVQQRGAKIIEARGASSAASAANAAIDSVNAVWRATPAGDWSSLAVVSRGEYGVPEGLQFGFPVAADGQGGWKVVEGLEHDAFSQERIRITTEELIGERDDVRGLGLIP